MMSGITFINDLPYEIIIKILRYVDEDSLPNAILTCKLWKDVIESSCPMSINLYHVNQVGFDELWIDFMMTTNRKFHTIKLDGILELGNNKTIDIFQRHGFSVVKLCLIQSCLDSFSVFAQMLKCMPNLKQIIIFETSTLCGVSDVPPEDDLPDLRKLKTLDMVGSEYSIIKCFQRAKLATLKVLNSTFEHSMDSEPFEDFLKSQEMLTTLALRSIDHETSQIFRTERLNCTMPFQLTKLSLLNIKLQESPNDYNNLLKFLKPQAKTLKVLELGRNFPNFVYEFVFAQMRNLRTLQLQAHGMSSDKEFYERLEENTKIVNLILLDSANSTFLHNFLKCVPNVRNLTLMDYCDKEMFLAIAQRLTQLKTLTASTVNGDNFDGVQFTGLTSLNIQSLDGMVDWNKFTIDNAQLTELIIEQIFDEEFLNFNNVENITKNTKLHTLKLGEYFSANKRSLEMIRENCPDLKVLEMHKFCGIDDPNELSDWVPVLRLCEDDVIKCPKGLTFWNDDDYDGRLPNDENDWDTLEGALAPFDVDLLNEDFYHFYHDFPSDDDYSDWNNDNGEDENDDSDFDRQSAD